MGSEVFNEDQDNDVVNVIETSCMLNAKSYYHGTQLHA